MQPPQYRGDVFATHLVSRTDLLEMFGHLTGRGAEDITAEGFICCNVPKQMMGWEQLGPIDAIADSN
jgi:hypothetical protein